MLSPRSCHWIITLLLAVSIQYRESAYLLPTTRTRIELYTSRSGWNSASENCRKNGGRLVQVETAQRHTYINSICKKFLQIYGSRIEAWIGLVIKQPYRSTFLWTENCVAVCHNHWYRDWHREPNDLDSDFCVRISSEGGLDYFWLTTSCSERIRSLCEFISDETCDYDLNEDMTVSLGTVAMETNTFMGSLCECKKSCDSQVLTKLNLDLECWGFSYNIGTRTCVLVYSDDPYVMDKPLAMTPSLGTSVHVKRCFQLSVNSDPQTSTLRGRSPNSPCYRGSASVTCEDLKSKVSPTAPERLCHLTTSSEFDVITKTSRESMGTKSWTTIDFTNVGAHGVESTTKNNFVSAEHIHTLGVSTPDDGRSHGVSTTRVWTFRKTTPRNTTSCQCPCTWNKHPQNITKALFTKIILKDLVINKRSLSSNRRKHISVYESRSGPVALGSAWIITLLLIYVLILISDIFLHEKIHDLNIAKSSSRGYGYGKRKVRPIPEKESPKKF